MMGKRRQRATSRRQAASRSCSPSVSKARAAISHAAAKSSAGQTVTLFYLILKREKAKRAVP